SPRRTSPIATEEEPRESRAASLYGFSTGMIASTPGIAASGFSRRSASGPMTPMITRDAPRLICASSPNSRTRVTIRWICSSVALGCVITIILLVRDHQNEVSRNFLQAWIQDPKITRPFCRIELLEWFGLLSLRKGEERGEGFIVSKSGEPLTLILSPSCRGEAKTHDANMSPACERCGVNGSDLGN